MTMHGRFEAQRGYEGELLVMGCSCLLVAAVRTAGGDWTRGGSRGVDTRTARGAKKERSRYAWSSTRVGPDCASYSKVSTIRRSSSRRSGCDIRLDKDRMGR